MAINVFPAHELPDVFRALRTALAPAGQLDAAERAFLDSYARITGHVLDAAEPQPITPEAVVVAGAHAGKRLVPPRASTSRANRRASL